MKTLKLRVWSLGLALFALSFTTGCHQQRVKADVPPVFSSPLTGEVKNPDLPPIPLALPESDSTNPLPTLALGAPADTYGHLQTPTDTPPTNAAPPRMVQEPTLPQNAKISPSLAEVVKLIQAGVSEEVILSYITNSTVTFNATADNIVYLNDLGVSTAVITAIVQHDSSPEMQANNPSLPPGVALTTPATNVYPEARAGAPVVSYAQPAQPVEQTGELPPAVETAPPAGESVTINYFYDSLAPYGSWVDVDGYGLCWRPTVAVANPHWRPYSHAGRWMWSDAGWYWYSDYSWGWAPFHYGRWASYPRLGWLWVPDTVWGPSWVTWRYSPSYCGWAPLPPGCHYRGGGLYYYNRHVGIGFDFGFSSSYYCYVPSSRFCDWNPSRHILPLHNVTHVHKNTTIINNFGSRGRDVINRGPEVGAIAKAVKTKVPQVRIRDEPLQTARAVKPERVETIGGALGVVRPQLPKNPPKLAARPRHSGDNRVRPAVTPTSLREPARPTIGNSLGQAAAKPAEQPRRNTVTPQQRVRVSPPVVTGNNTPQNNGARNGIGNSLLGDQQRNQARPDTRNSGQNVARANPSPGTMSPVETPRANRNEQRPRNEGILVQPFRDATRNNPAPAPRVNAPSRRNDAPIRSYANPTPTTPRVERPATVAPRANTPAPRTFNPAPAPRQEFVRPQGGGFGGAVSAPQRSYSAPQRSHAPPASVPRSAPSVSVQRSAPPAVSAPAPSRSSGGGGISGAVRSGGGGGGNGGGKGGRNRD